MRRTSHGDLPRRRIEGAGENPQQRRLAGAVDPDDSKTFPAVDVEADPAQRPQRVVSGHPSERHPLRDPVPRTPVQLESFGQMPDRDGDGIDRRVGRNQRQARRGSGVAVRGGARRAASPERPNGIAGKARRLVTIAAQWGVVTPFQLLLPKTDVSLAVPDLA